MTVLILDNYDSFTYNLAQMTQAQTDRAVVVPRNDALDWEALKALSPSHIIISPGPGHPANPADFGICTEVLQRHPELNCPILGVCLGHQGLVHVLGGQVIPAPEIMHGKTSQVRKVKNSPLLDGLPDPFTVMRYHSWMVDRQTLPAELEVIAETVDAADSENSELFSKSLVMAVQHRSRPLFGVQFHPESIGTPEGGWLLANFLSV